MHYNHSTPYKCLIPFVVACICICSVPSMAGWTVYESELTRNNFLAVHAVSEGNDTYQMIVGDQGNAWLGDIYDFWPTFSTACVYNFRAVQMVSSHFAIAVGENGLCMVWDGSGWQEVATGVTGSLNGICAISESEIYIVGNGGVILFWDGLTMQPMTSGTTSDLNAVNGKAGDDTFVAGNNGTILRKNGSNWISVSSSTTEDLLGITKPHQSGTLVCGTGGTILSYDGADWTSLDTGTTMDLNAIALHRNVPFKGYAVGENGTIVEVDGTDCTIMPSPTQQSLRGITFKSSFFNLTCVGDNGTILHYDGQGWQEFTPFSDLTCVHGYDADHMYAAGEFGRLIVWYGSCVWQTIQTGTSTDFTAVHAAAEETVYVAGTDGWIYKWDGTEMTQFTQSPAGSINGMCWIDSDDIYVLGQTGTYEEIGGVYHYNGADWTAVVTDDGTVYCDIYAVGTNEVYAVGTQYQVYIPPVGPPVWQKICGTVRMFDGNAWHLSQPALCDWNSVWSLGAGEAIMTLDSAPCLAYVTADDCYPVHTSADGFVFSDLTCVWGTGPDSLLAAGSVMLHFDGWSWSELDVPPLPGTTLYDLYGTAMDNVWFVGDHQTILNWTGTLPAHEESGAFLKLNQHEFHAGDAFSLDVKARNSETVSLSGKLFVALDVGADIYFFWPSWTHFPPEVDYQPVNLSAGQEQTYSILSFTNPPLSAWYHCRWYSVLLDSGDNLFGDFDYEDFSLAP
jgi:hypothetical protein